jgi:hypothetical protein
LTSIVRTLRPSLLLVLAACGSSKEVPPPAPAPAPYGDASTCEGPKALTFTIAGTRLCENAAIVLGHGVGDDGRIDLYTDLLMERGEGLQPRRYLDTYPADRPFGVTLSPQFKTVDAQQYTLFFGIGGLRRSEWVAPITKPVIPNELSYSMALRPTAAGAYVQMSKQKLDKDGLMLTSGTYRSKSGSVTFQELDLDRRHYKGHVDLVFERWGPLAPADGPDLIEVKGDFDLPPR